MKKFLVRTLLLTGLVVGQGAHARACDRPVHYFHPVSYSVTYPVAPVQTTTVSQTSITALVVTATRPSLPEIPAGSSMRIKVNFLGNQTGHVFLNVGKLVMECKVVEWTPSYVVFALPELGLLEATEATIDVTKPEGLVARSTRVKLTPTQDVEIVESAEIVPRAARKISARVPAVTGGLTVTPASIAAASASAAPVPSAE